jgi:tetratricopeptide (TPR) repeat protein
VQVQVSGAGEKMRRTMWALVFVIALTCAWSLSVSAGPIDVQQLYLESRFAEIVVYFELDETRKDFRKLSLADKLLYIECLARTGRSNQAEQKLAPLLTGQDIQAETAATAGIVYFAGGRPGKAKSYIDRALAADPGSKRAHLARVMLHLFYRQFEQAKAAYEKLLTLNPRWAGSNLLFSVGLEVYRWCGDVPGLTRLYKTHAARTRSKNPGQTISLKADAKMYRKALKKKLFSIETGSDRVAVPFSTDKTNFRENTIDMTAGGKHFKVLLDTGNATGWLVHSRTLRALLKAKTGGKTLNRIGTELILLDGYRQLYKTLDFTGFKILNADGVYVPKPRPNFPDANLNPYFISGRVVSIDFAGKQMIIRTKNRFETDLAQWAAANPGNTVVRLPWLGYKHAFVSVRVKGDQGMAMIETGAEDIAFSLEFARDLRLPLKPERKYLGSGQVFPYHVTAAVVSLGNLKLKRDAAEVWPFKRFFERITGLTPHVIIGPFALKNKFRISFDPFDKEVVLVRLSNE